MIYLRNRPPQRSYQMDRLVVHGVRAEIPRTYEVGTTRRLERYSVINPHELGFWPVRCLISTAPRGIVQLITTVVPSHRGHLADEPRFFD